MNIQVGQEWAEINASKSQEIAEICSNYAWTGSILNLRLHQLRNIEWLEKALVAVRKTKNQNAEGAHLDNLGIAHKDLGELAKPSSTTIRHWIYSREIGDRRGEENNLGNLGLAYSNQGEPARPSSTTIRR